MKKSTVQEKKRLTTLIYFKNRIKNNLYSILPSDRHLCNRTYQFIEATIKQGGDIDYLYNIYNDCFYLSSAELKQSDVLLRILSLERLDRDKYYSMPHLRYLFQNKPELGFGEQSVFTGTVQDIADAVKMLDSIATNAIIRARTEHLERAETKQTPIIGYDDWLDEIKQEESFKGYMLRTFERENGRFKLDISITELDSLAYRLLF